MREVAFIKQNKEKWLEVEQVIQKKIKKNPDDLSSLYINLVNDLSFAQTYYPKSKTTVYLNHLSVQIFQKIYKTRRIEKNRFFYFFKTEVPLLLYEYRKYIYSTFIFFLIFVLIGVFSAIYDKEFVKIILGEGYVNMTIENIKKGNPIKVYDGGEEWAMAFYIIMNNLMVGAKMYLYGVFGGVGSLWVLIQNCIMLGSFQYFFHEYGALKDSLKGIWLHGTFEIFAMIIECAAGLILGTSILFPKTYSRLEAFKKGVVNSFKIFISTVPFTIVAGWIEGYVSRHGLTMPVWLNSLIIFGCLFIVVFYYLVYPLWVRRKVEKEMMQED
ncbi:stage II sporulation protein M [Bergeyella zoohelcum]|uniref:Integral membrane protein DUF95 n=1 Tax=Bergeyella zoohelcum TaxID=1015 RepID=A0A7Z8YLZ0_9FLAO|nr:stage II sporulation protein M [Bergeyella zoohelcum]VDH02589.1 Integral membrane protein DUF95 [Bergeyella zoohelcum]